MQDRPSTSAPSWLVDDRGNTPLHTAVMQGDVSLLKSHLRNFSSHRDYFEKINQTNSDGNTALHLACMQNTDNTVAIISSLIRRGAEIELLNNDNQFPFHYLGPRFASVIKQLNKKNTFIGAFIGKQISLQIESILKLTSKSKKIFLLDVLGDVPSKFPQKSVAVMIQEFYALISKKNKKYVLLACQRALIDNPDSETLGSFYLACKQERVLSLKELVILKLQYDPTMLSFFTETQPSESEKGKEKVADVDTNNTLALISSIPVDLHKHIPDFLRKLREVAGIETDIQPNVNRYRLANLDREIINQSIQSVEQLRIYLINNQDNIIYTKNDNKCFTPSFLITPLVYFTSTLLIEGYWIYKAVTQSQRHFGEADYVSYAIPGGVFGVGLGTGIVGGISYGLTYLARYFKASRYNNTIENNNKQNEVASLISMRKTLRLSQQPEITQLNALQKCMQDLDAKLVELANVTQVKQAGPVVTEIKNILIEIRKILNLVNQPILAKNSNQFFYHPVIEDDERDIEKGHELSESDNDDEDATLMRKIRP